MKYILIIMSVFFLSTNQVMSEEKNDCSNFKKFSMKYTWCKSKNAGKSLKDKMSNLGKDKKLTNIK